MARQNVVPLDMGSNKITSVTDPTSAQDAATKHYVDTPRVTTITSSATPAVNTDTADAVSITALAAAANMTTSLTGTVNNFQRLTYRIKDNGSPQTLTWGTSFEACGFPLPTTTVAGKRLTVQFIGDSVTGKWGCVAYASEA